MVQATISFNRIFIRRVTGGDAALLCTGAPVDHR